MRLVCPNCDAEYEVDGAAIPRAGRDVQCSNCGHAWFQTHPKVLAEQDAEEALFGAPEPGAAPVNVDELEAMAEAGSDLGAAQVAELGSVAMADPVASPSLDPAPKPPVDAMGNAPQPFVRNIDDRVLAVLREEAARETAARRAEAGPSPLETQTEMPLEPGAKPARRGKMTSASPPPEFARPESAITAQVPDAVARPEAARSRRDLFPAIDEVNSTLRATSDRVGDKTGVDLVVQAEPWADGGFGRGLLTMVLIAVILLALYVFAPLIGQKVPALAGTAQAYVAAVNAARLWLDGEIKVLVGWLRGLEGGAQG